MYISPRGALVRNVAAAAVNSAITLMLLLIAPLGLAAVISNTLAIAFSTFFVCMAADFVVAWLLQSSKQNHSLRSHPGEMTRSSLKQDRREQGW